MSCTADRVYTSHHQLLSPRPALRNCCRAAGVWPPRSVHCGWKNTPLCRKWKRHPFDVVGASSPSAFAPAGIRQTDLQEWVRGRRIWAIERTMSRVSG